MDVHVDRDKCEGFGFCEEAAPEVFALDDDGVLHITHAAAQPPLATKLASAVRRCPVAALRLVEAGA